MPLSWWKTRAGGGGVIACQKTMRAKPDGYTLMQGYVATLGTSPATRKVPYDPIKDFTAVGMIGGTPNVLVVNAKLPINNLKEFVAYAKAHSNMNYGSAGAGSLTHLLMELLQQQAGTKMVHIAYKGIAPAFTDLLGQQTQAMFPGLAAAVPHLRSGTVRAIALTGDQRNSAFPDVPTFKELGLEGFEDVLQWYGVSGPAGMDSGVVQTLNYRPEQSPEGPGADQAAGHRSRSSPCRCRRPSSPLTSARISSGGPSWRRRSTSSLDA